MSNTLTEKAVVDRLKTLFEEIATLQEDVKQLVKDAKEQELPAAWLKKLAKLEVDGKLEEYREEFEAMQDVARAVGIDELELEPVLPRVDAKQLRETLDNIVPLPDDLLEPVLSPAGNEQAVDEAIKRFASVPPYREPSAPFDDAKAEFDRDAALTIPPSLRRAP